MHQLEEISQVLVWIQLEEPEIFGALYNMPCFVLEVFG
jgi:hypothetical protein